MASAAIGRRGAVFARGILVTVHDLYGGSWPLQPLELYLRYGRDLDVQPFRYHPRRQDLSASGERTVLVVEQPDDVVAATDEVLHAELAELLRSLKPHTADDGVNFVTHGYGALVLREAFLRVDWNYTKAKVVMLAPPNRGLQYYRSMKSNVGFAGYGGVAAEELAAMSSEMLDQRLGKLPRRCYPLVVSGSLSFNPFNQANYPNDGLIALDETALPGEFRQRVVAAPHYLIPSHPLVFDLVRGFLEA